MHSLSRPTQTLASLSLAWNQIGDEGVQHLTTVLRENEVRSVEMCSSLIITRPLPLYDPTQTITSLDLGGNQIGNEGVQHLVTALRGNKVGSIMI